MIARSDTTWLTYKKTGGKYGSGMKSKSGFTHTNVTLYISQQNGGVNMDDFVAKAEALIQQLRAAEERERATRWVPMTEGDPKNQIEVDLFAPLFGRITGCAWSNGRGCWVRTTSHGIEELHLDPTHWRHIPENPK